MPDFGAPVAQDVNVNPGQGLDMLSKLLNLKQQQQNLQTTAIQQQGLQAEVQQQQQTAGQRSAAAQFFQNYDVTQHVGPDGTLDLNQALSHPGLRATGDAYPAIAQQLVGIKNAQLTAKQSLASLDSGLRQDFYKNIGGLSTDPDVKAGNNKGVGTVLDEIDRFGQSSPEAARVASIYKPIIQGLQQSGKTAQLSHVLRNFQLQAQDAGAQTAQTYGTPSAVDTGAAVVPGVTKPAAEGGGFVPAGGAIAKQIAPGVTYATDATGQAFQVPNQNPGAAKPVGGGGYTQPIANQKEAMADIENARKAAPDLQTSRNINAHLLTLSSQTSTGPLSAWTSKAAAAAGLPQGSGIQEIDAYLQRQAMTQALAMPHTNAGLESAQKIMGTTSYTPQALQEKVKFSDALNSGAIAYTRGLNAAVGTGRNPDLSHYNAFRSAWAQNFDPDIYRAEDAIRRGDKAELAAIKQRIGPQGMRDLAVKSANLRQLERGVIPGG